jgi:uncharacterized membrane protein YdjX (TVP38/TMEM64 family)
MGKKFFSKTNINFVLFISFIFIFIFAGKIFSVDSESIDSFLKSIPILPASTLFVFVYVLGTFIVWQMKDPLKIVGAVVFGAYLSTLLIYIAEIINAYIFFTLSKVLGRQFVEKRIKGRFKRFYERLENMSNGWVFMLRFVPLIPYRVLDLSFGLSKFPFRKYIIVVLLASPIRIFAIQFVLAAVKDLSFSGVQTYFLENQQVAFCMFLYFLAAVVVAFRLKRKEDRLED